MILEKDKNIALLTQISGFGSYIFPFGSIIIPFIIRETKKDESCFMNDLTKEVINFNLSYLLYTFALKLFILPIFVGAVFQNIFANNYQYHFNGNFDADNFFGIISLATILSIMAVVKFVLIIKASIEAHEGHIFKYPYTIEFIK